AVLESEVSDVVSALFHTILLHRTLPTLDFKGGAVSYNSYLGVRDVDCKNIDLTYVCINSSQLIEKVTNAVAAFIEACTVIAIQLIQMVIKGGWLGPEASVWERWIVNICLKTIHPNEKEAHRRQLSSQLRDELCTILEHFNSPSVYTPSLGSSQAETEHIIDFSMSDISPYRFSISHLTATGQSRSGTE
ncbi:unnamed protein product, partial [Heterobilharzia americana]